MHLRRLACFLLGGWIVGSALLLFVTSGNYDAAEEVARSPQAGVAKALSTVPGEQRRMVLFHMANEASRSNDTLWAVMQLSLGLGAAVALFLEPRTRFFSAGAGLMLLLVLFEWFIIMPQLEWLGRSVDFVPFKAYSGARDQYWNLRAVFLGMEAMKLLVGAGITLGLLLMRSRQRGPRPEADEVEPKDGRTESLRKTRTRSRSSRSGQHTPGT